MAVIMKIRDRFGIIVSVLIAFALIGFIVSSALNNSTSFGLHSDVIGKVNGRSIHAKELDQEVSHQEENYKLFSPDGRIDDETSQSFREQAWNKIVNQYITNEEFVKLALITGEENQLSAEENKDLFFGSDPAPLIKSNFSDPKSGFFDPNNVKQFIDGLKNEKDPKRLKSWENIAEMVVQGAPVNKYAVLLSKSFYVPKWMAEVDFHDKNDKASIHFITAPYSLVPDKDAPVSEDEMKKYLNEHKDRFKQEQTERAVDFVIFPVNPSKDDTNALVDFMNKAAIAYQGTDTNEIKKNSDRPDDTHYYKKEELKSNKSDSIFKLKNGAVYGPFFEEGFFKLFKVIDKREVPDSVKLAQIFFQFKKADDSATVRKKADSVYAILKKGKITFDTLVAKFTEDQRTKATGGDVGWIKQGVLPPAVKSIDQFLFKEAKKKDDYKLVKTDIGYHILRVEDIGLFYPAMKIAFLSRPLTASGATDKIVYQAANTFASKYRTDSAFLKAARSQKLNLQDVENMKPNDQKAVNLPAKELVRWVYEAKKGDVSQVITCGDKYVVALLTRIAEEGTKTLEDPIVRRTCEAEIRKQKKAAIIKTKYFAGPASANLESYASALNTQVQEAKDIIGANPFIPNLGFEPKVIGAIFAGKSGQTLKPVEGDNGIYVITIDELNVAAPVADYTQNRQQLMQMYGGQIQRQQQEVLRRLLRVEDLRYKIYNQN